MVLFGCDPTNRRPDLSIIAPGWRAARMPGTGSLRRSGAAARMKAIVGKSRVEAEELQRPAFVFPGSVIGLTFLGGGLVQGVSTRISAKAPTKAFSLRW